MYKLKVFITGIGALIMASSFAQRNTLSPYSEFGLGLMHQSNNTTSKAMGGTGLATRYKNQINILNPASLTSQDTLSFVLDVALRTDLITYNSTSFQNDFNKANLDHFSFSFPVGKKWFTSLGVYPFSDKGYNAFRIKNIENSELLERKSVRGEGGITRLNFANAYKLNEHFSIGLNTDYIFGEIEQQDSTIILNSDTSLISAVNTAFIENIGVKKFLFELGAQYYTSFREDHHVTIGATYSFASKLNAKRTKELYTLYYGSDLAGYSIDTNSSFTDSVKYIKYPSGFGIGVSYNYKNRLYATFDFASKNWSEYEEFGIKPIQLKNTNTYRIGLEYTHDPYTLKRGTLLSYLARVKFRAGAYYNDGNLQLNGQNITIRGLSAGVGLPLSNSKTTFNISYEIGKQGLTDNGLIEESFQQITIGFSLFDYWFYQSKFD